LLEAADALDDGRSPLDHAFLSEHGVTLDEACTLAANLALGARLVIEMNRRLGEGPVPMRQIVADIWVAAMGAPQ
jgi:hypothetical protein